MASGGYADLGRAHCHDGSRACPAAGCGWKPDKPSYLAAAYDMRASVNSIVTRAQEHRLDVTPEKVFRHYKWFLRWYEGRLATGHLIRRTAIKFKDR